MHHVYDGELDINSILVTDKMNSYVKFTNAIGMYGTVENWQAKKGIYTKETDTEKRKTFLNFVLATLKTDKCRDLSNRPAIPLSHKLEFMEE